MHQGGVLTCAITWHMMALPVAICNCLLLVLSGLGKDLLWHLIVRNYGVREGSFVCFMSARGPISGIGRG